MKRIIMAVFAALLLLCGCENNTADGSAAVPAASLAEFNMAEEQPPQARTVADYKLDAQQQGYTISYTYSDSWAMEQERAEDIRYTYYLVDEGNQVVFYVAEIALQDGQELSSPIYRQHLLMDLQLGDAVKNSEAAELFGEEGLRVEFSQNPGNTPINGLMYLFQWRGYVYGFAVLGAEMTEEGEALLQAVLEEVVLE